MNIEQYLTDKKPNLSDTSIKKYTANINKLYKGIGKKKGAIRSLRFLFLDYKKIIDYINKTYDNSLSKSSYLSTAFIVLETMKQTKGIKEAINAYREEYNPHKQKYTDRVNSNTPTTKQKDNFIKYGDLIKYANELTDPQYKAVALISLYYPRRTDLKDVRLIKLTDYNKLSKTEQKKHNWLVVSRKEGYIFYFNIYKTCKIYDTCIIKVDNKDVKEAITDYLKVRNNTTDRPLFIYAKKGGALTDKTYSRYISNIFKGTGKNITPNIIRHIFVSQNVEQHKADQKIASNMSHSLSSQKQYILDFDLPAADN